MRLDQSGRGLADTLIFLSAIIAVVAFVGPEYMDLGTNLKPSEKQQVSRDLDTLLKAIELLESETGELVGLPGPNPCVNAPEFFVTKDCRQGLLCNDGRYGLWNGPYLKRELSDPWGQAYYIDNDYKTDKGLARVIGSLGPNGVQDPFGKGDDTIRVLCQRGS